jgi:ABC-type sugar transport system permease subunit
MLMVIVPMVASFLLFWIYPIVAAFIKSFTNWQGFMSQAPFVGLDNYVRAANDPIFRQALVNTLVFVAISLPIGIGGALILALLINAAGRMKEAFRVVYFLPVVSSTIATAFVWRYLYQPQLGVFNQILEMLHLPEQRWLLSPNQALACVAMYAVWQGLGYTMVLFMAGLTTIDSTFFDAARVDGAGSWQTFRNVTLPLLRPTFTFVLVTNVINGLQIFAPIYVMTSSGITAGESPPGGPANSTMVIVVYQWLIAFRELQLGYGAAMGVILLAIILVLTLLQLRWLRTRWEY